MGITYKGLLKMLVEREKQLQDLHNDCGISWGTISKVDKDEYIKVQILEKIALYLQCDIGDLISIKKDSAEK